MRQDFSQGVKGPWGPFPPTPSYDLPLYPEAHLAMLLIATNWQLKIHSGREAKSTLQFLGTCMTRPLNGCSCGLAVAVNSTFGEHCIAQQMFKLD
jgi:hypothetical protein